MPVDRHRTLEAGVTLMLSATKREREREIVVGVGLDFVMFSSLRMSNSH